MALIAKDDANRKKVDISESLQQKTHPAGEALDAFDVVRQDSVTGRWVKTDVNALTAAKARSAYGMVVKKVQPGESVTAIRRGRISGLNIAALGYGAALFLSDTNGRVADAAGTVSKCVAMVEAVDTNPIGTAPSKILMIDFNGIQ